MPWGRRGVAKCISFEPEGCNQLHCCLHCARRCCETHMPGHQRWCSFAHVICTCVGHTRTTQVVGCFLLALIVVALFVRYRRRKWAPAKEVFSGGTGAVGSSGVS